MAQMDNYKILIVDDNMMNLQILAIMLKNLAIQSDLAENGLEGVNLFKAHTYDLIFMDLSMPVMDGFEASAEIRKLEKADSKIPIIACTGTDAVTDSEQAEKSGITDFIIKPFSQEELSRILEKYLYSNTSAFENQAKFEYNPGLDTTFLKQAYGNSYEQALDMFQLFDQIIDEEMALVTQSIEAGNIGLIKKHLNKIKPTLSLVGLSSIIMKIDTLEGQLLNQPIESTKKEMQAIKEDLDVFLPIIKKEIEHLKMFCKKL
jgi:CheY-like chemotaxis protein